MKHNLKKPCRECPWRRKSAPGYLGADEPTNFLRTTMAETPMPCHLTVDYETPNRDDLDDLVADAELCAGARIFFANICKMPRDRELTRHRLPADRVNVFASPTEFLEHHTPKPRRAAR